MSRLEKIEEIYYAALERSSEERAAFLAVACGNDDALRGEVESLLSFAEPAQDFIETPPEDLAADFLARPASRNIVGQELGHYRVLSVLGAGGMGEVFLAEDTRLGRQAALKMLPLQFAHYHERKARFEQEARAASALNHPNIITIYGIEKVDNLDFIATEFIDGQTLRERILEKPFSPQETIDIGLQIAGALEAAHSVGVVHRDIKPANIMLRRDGYVKVLDFGLAKLTMANGAAGDFSTRDHTAPNRVMGTIGYMSPEQALGQKLDARTDIFSLGVVMYEMLSGAQPFCGPSDAAVYNAIINENPPPLNESNPEIPFELDRVISRALAKDREQRYQTAGELLSDLKDAKKELEAQGRTEYNSAPGRRNQIFRANTRKTLSTSSAGGVAPEISKLNLRVALSLLLTALVGAGLWFFFLRTATEAAPIDSIAVLPFQNKGSDANTEYLSDGLAESLIYRLSQLPNLKVSPTSSVFRYKGKDTDVTKIAHELKVDAIMTGRLVERGDNLAISVELVDARNNKLLWGEQYERKMSELLATQREIVAEITNSLKLKLSGEGLQKLTKKYTDNSDAYQLYLKGRFLYGKRTKDDILKGIEYFRQAIKLDPNFALAYVGISDCYNILPTYSYLSPKEAIPQAKTAAQKALVLDPTLAEAHATLAFSLSVLDWNWVEAEREYKRAFELNPNIAEIHYRYGLDYLIPMGRTAEAVAEIKRALELEPLSLATASSLAGAYIFARQNDQALEQARKVHDLDPDFVSGLIWLAYVYVNRGMYQEAIAVSEKSLRTAPASQPFLRVAGYAYAKSGRRQEAEEMIKRFQSLAEKQYVAPTYVASIYAALGERDKALTELEKACAERDYLLPRLTVDPLLDSLRDDPRFAALVKRIGLPL